MKKITFTADERLIEAAREQAAADNATLDEQFRRWQAERAMQTLSRLQDKYSSGVRKFTRDEMNERR